MPIEPEAVAAQLTEAVIGAAPHGFNESMIQPGSIGCDICCAAMNLRTGPLSGSGLGAWSSPNSKVSLTDRFPPPAVERIVEVATAAHHPRVRAKLFDVAWCTEPRRAGSATLALRAYLDCLDEERLAEIDQVPFMTTTADDESRCRRRFHFVVSRLGRAREIAAKVGESDLLRDCDGRLHSIAKESLNRGACTSAVQVLEKVSSKKLVPDWLATAPSRPEKNST